MDRRQLWKRVRQVWVTTGLVFTAVFVVWSLVAYQASDDAKAAMVSDTDVLVQYEGGVWSFTRESASNTSSANASAADAGSLPALVFFPGALVDPIAYAPLARAVAAAGYPTFIVEIPRRAAFGGATSPELRTRLTRVLTQPTTPRRWVAAGHSRGAVVASDVAASSPTGLSGVVLIGSSHPRDVDLSGLHIPVAKIVGTRDGLASREEVEANRGKVPVSTRWEWIEGGNHSQFGWYGFQPGDRPATIDAQIQRATMIRVVLELMAGIAHDNLSVPSA